MSSIRCNSRVKSWRNQIRSTKITKIKPFIKKYNWERINFSSEKDDWKNFEKNNVTIALNVLYAKIYPANVSKYNSNREKHVISLIIPNEERRGRSKTLAKRAKSKGRRCHYLAVKKKLLPLLRGITSKSTDDFYCLNCLHSFRTKNKLESHKKVSEN